MTRRNPAGTASASFGLRQAMRMGFVVDVVDGVLNLQFARSAGATTDPRLDAFEILALPPGSDVFRDGFEQN